MDRTSIAVAVYVAFSAAVRQAVEAMRLASHKLPVATRVVVREGAKEA